MQVKFVVKWTLYFYKFNENLIEFWERLYFHHNPSFIYDSMMFIKFYITLN